MADAKDRVEVHVILEGEGVNKVTALAEKHVYMVME